MKVNDENSRIRIHTKMSLICNTVCRRSLLTRRCCCVQAAIKMLTKVVEKQSPGSLSQHLGDMMPGLLKAYDNVESSVRKAAVFCIVALHQLVGEATLQVRDSSTIYEVVRRKVNHVLRSKHF